MLVNYFNVSALTSVVSTVVAVVSTERAVLSMVVSVVSVETVSLQDARLIAATAISAKMYFFMFVCFLYIL